MRHVKSVGQNVDVTLDRQHSAAKTERLQPRQLLLPGTGGAHLNTLEHSRDRLFGADDPESAIFGQTQYHIGVIVNQPSGSRLDLTHPDLWCVHADQQDRKRRHGKRICYRTGQALGE